MNEWNDEGHIANQQYQASMQAASSVKVISKGPSTLGDAIDNLEKAINGALMELETLGDVIKPILIDDPDIGKTPGENRSIEPGSPMTQRIRGLYELVTHLNRRICEMRRHVNV
jgi:hypothetical protein